MLSIINAAEVQFRHETESRTRDHALLASIRDRRAAEAALAAAGGVGARRHAAPAPAPIGGAARTTRMTWSSPIGVKDCATTACATG